MRKISRKRTPSFLKEKGKEWTEKVITNNKFSWYRYKGVHSNFQAIYANKLMYPFLAELTQSHCSFCDLKGLTKGVCEQTVEHFYAKGKFLKKSYEWDNLFLCCRECQKSKTKNLDNKKGNEEEYSDLLKPDDFHYKLGKYFSFCFISGKIEVNPSLENDKEIEKANNTILAFNLCQDERNDARLEEAQNYAESYYTAKKAAKSYGKFNKSDYQNLKLDNWSYRDFIESYTLDYTNDLLNHPLLQQ